MYIAFRCLLVLGVALWAGLCVIEMYIKYFKENASAGSYIDIVPIFKNDNNEKSYKKPIETAKNSVFLHYFTFFAGALLVSVLNNKNELILLTKNKITRWYYQLNYADYQIKYVDTINNLNITAKRIRSVINVAIPKYFTKIKENSKYLYQKIIQNIPYNLFRSGATNPLNLNFMLLKKLKELTEERKKLGLLLIAAVHENKNLKMHYQLETMAKNRLARHVEESQRQIKERRIKYISFQQLYLVTHQENCFLRARVTKLTKEKEKAEKSLMSVLNLVYKSSNAEIKAHCSRFLVKNKDNLMKFDVSVEIEKFLENVQDSASVKSKSDVSEQSSIQLNNARSWPLSHSISELRPADQTVAPLFMFDAPKLKGLPGECIWTVKDKDGIIEKLYEYDSCSYLDTGDTIRRIREYSVYHDNDCFLDFATSRSVMNRESRSSLNYPSSSESFPLANQKFLTGSEVFKSFLEDNIVSSNVPAPPLLCG